MIFLTKSLSAKAETVITVFSGRNTFNLPFLGGMLNLLATILGLGLMVRLWLNRASRDPEVR